MAENVKKKNVTKSNKKVKTYVKPKEIRAGGMFEYKMPAALAKSLLKERKGADAKMDTQDFLCSYVNDQYCLLGTCVRVIFG